MQDSEHLDLDIETLRAGAHSLLTDRTKGVWYVIEVLVPGLSLAANSGLPLYWQACRLE